MSDLYEISEIADNPGPPPVKLVDMKKTLRLPEGDHPDDDLVTLLTKMSTDDVEAYTARSFRITTWLLYLDAFADRIYLRRDPIDEISEVEYLVDNNWTVISSDVYYLKKGPQRSELLLQSGQTWPTDLDDIEHGIRVTLTTSIHPNVDVVRAAIRRHVSYMYENRGDSDPANSRDSFKASGCEKLLQRSRIARV